MKTITADDQKRVQLPDAFPHQVFAYENHGDGTITLTAVKQVAPQPFPKGSLAGFLTPERDQEQLAFLQGCSLQLPPE